MPPLIHRDILPRDLDPKTDPTLSELNARFAELYKQVNTQAGYYGNATIFGTLNLNGNRISNVGKAQAATDVLTQTSADPMYSTAVQQSAMEAVGSKMLQTTRRLNDGTQQHTVSSDLNTQGSIPPSNVTGSLVGVPGTTSVAWTWTSIIVQLADLSYKAVVNNSLTVTGLTNGEQYYFYPYFDTKLGILSFVADSVNGVGNPPVAFVPGGSYIPQESQNQNADTRIALTAAGSNAAVTPGSGITVTAGLRTRT